MEMAIPAPVLRLRPMAATASRDNLFVDHGLRFGLNFIHDGQAFSLEDTGWNHLKSFRFDHSHNPETITWIVPRGQG
jgi:hypothetical protein